MSDKSEDPDKRLSVAMAGLVAFWASKMNGPTRAMTLDLKTINAAAPAVHREVWFSPSPLNSDGVTFRRLRFEVEITAEAIGLKCTEVPETDFGNIAATPPAVITADEPPADVSSAPEPSAPAPDAPPAGRNTRSRAKRRLVGRECTCPECERMKNSPT